MKAVIDKLEDVAESLRGEYEARGGKFHLKVEGDYAPLIEANSKIAEFRDNNRALNSKVTELETKFAAVKDLDPVKYKAAVDKVAELEAAGIKDKGSVPELIKAAVKAAVEPLEQKLVERETSEKKAQEALAITGLENALRDIGLKANVDERAMPDFVRRGREVFTLVDGKPAARKGDQPVFSKSKPAEELSMEEWAGALRTDAPFLFKPSKGGGARPGDPFSGSPAAKTIIGTDPIEFGKNLEGIAKGEVVVQQ